MLSGTLGENLGNGPEWPQSVCGSSGVPVIVAGERDVLPAERRDVGEQFIGDNDALWAGRSGRRHRVAIIDHLAVAAFDEAAEARFRRWLADDALPREFAAPVLDEELSAWFARSRVTRPGAYRLGRILRSAYPSGEGRGGRGSGGLGGILGGLVPVPGQHLVQARRGVVVDPSQDVGEPGTRVGVVQLGGDDERIHGRGAVAAAV